MKKVILLTVFSALTLITYSQSVPKKRFGLGAQMQQALAVAVIGGFIVGLPMLLIVLPSLMLLVNKREVG